nr:hypothetical protein [Tanacetum cinerariifolium]
ATMKENKTLDLVLAKYLEPLKQGGKGNENDTKANNVDLVADMGVLDEKKLLRMKKRDMRVYFGPSKNFSVANGVVRRLKKGKDEQSKSNIKNIQVTDDVKKVEEDRRADPYEDAAKGVRDHNEPSAKVGHYRGLHPVVRDTRKSVANELVGLQEKLDSLTLVKTKTRSTKKVTYLEDDVIQDKSDQEHTQLNSNEKFMDFDLDICKNLEVKATESQDVRGESCDTNIEQQVEFRNEKTMKDSINNQLHLSVESTQPVDNATADKLDQPHAQFDCNTETMESNRVKSCETEDTNVIHETYDVKPEQVGEQNIKELSMNQHEMSVESELTLDGFIMM